MGILRTLLSGFEAVDSMHSPLARLHTLPPLYQYVAILIRIYPFAHATVAYLQNWPNECQRKYQDPFLVNIAKESLLEETGHDHLILQDLQDLKIPIEEALHQFQSDAIRDRILFFKNSVANNPLHFLAWLFFCEKQAVETVTAEVLQYYKKILGPFRKATRFFYIHSAVGPEVQHVEKRKKWIQLLPSHQQQIVMQEFHKITLSLSTQNFDLDVEKFSHFLNWRTPHLFDIAYRDRITNMNRLPLYRT